MKAQPKTRSVFPTFFVTFFWLVVTMPVNNESIVQWKSRVAEQSLLSNEQDSEQQYSNS
jgi:hypothetical protein